MVRQERLLSLSCTGKTNFCAILSHRLKPSCRSFGPCATRIQQRYRSFMIFCRCEYGKFKQISCGKPGSILPARCLFTGKYVHNFDPSYILVTNSNPARETEGSIGDRTSSIPTANTFLELSEYWQRRIANFWSRYMYLNHKALLIFLIG